MECEPPSPELIAEGDQKIANVIREVLDTRFPAHAPHLVINWHIGTVLMAEDGERYMWCIAQDGTRSWETLGMLEFAKQLENARIIQETMEN